jgi:hypothetical protein
VVANNGIAVNPPSVFLLSIAAAAAAAAAKDHSQNFSRSLPAFQLCSHLSIATELERFEEGPLNNRGDRQLVLLPTLHQI